MFDLFKQLACWLPALYFGLQLPSETSAAVAVISNRVSANVRFTVVLSGDKLHPDKTKPYSIESNDLVVVENPRGQTARLWCDTQAYDISPDSAYYLSTLADGKLQLGRIALDNVPVAEKPVIGAQMAVNPDATALNNSLRTISIKIFVDEEEPTRQAVWSRRLSGRVAEAAKILQKHCGIDLKVIEFGTWKSDNDIHDFDLAVAEFINETDPGKARLAIGFTSQYQIPQGRTHLGGTRGALQRHILLREWSKHVNEPEKTELLVHELGHHLGAVHSPQRDAVMRPLLADRQARAKQFTIRFDPLNTLAMNLVSEEIRDRGITQFANLSVPTKQKLRASYKEIDKALPEDPAAKIYLRQLGMPQASGNR